MNKKIIFVIAAAAIAAVLVTAVFLNRSAAPAGNRSNNPGLSADAKKLEDSGDLFSASQAYKKLISEHSDSREVADWQKKLEDLNIRLLFSPAVTPNSELYVIQPGDSLDKIARQFKTTVELIMKSNNLATDNIFPGKKIKIWVTPFSIVVDKSQNTLFLKCNEEVFKTYSVSTGANNSTPVGTFRITEKILNPPWYKPSGGFAPAGSPENILGTRWLGLDKEGYGIHGTTDPQSLGKQATAGCVRMLNAEVEQLYSIVPQGTEVTIVD